MALHICIYDFTLLTKKNQLTTHIQKETGDRHFSLSPVWI